MPAFEDIAASDYDEPPEVLLEWLETSASLPEAAAGPASIGLEELPPHRHTDIHRSTSSGLMVMKPQHETVDLQDEHDPENEFGFDNLMAHAQYISSLHHGLVNAAKDPSAQDQYIEGLAAALLEFSIPEVWKDLNMQDMGRHNAEPLLSIMQNWLDTASLVHLWRRRILYLMVKVAAANHALPNQLFLPGVVFDDLQNPWRAGGFADIFKGTFRSTKVVGKRLRVYGADKKDLHSALCNETLVWKQLQHPSILPFLGLDRRSLGSTESLYLISPQMQCTLWEFITNETNYCARDDLYRLLWEVAEGLAYLHGVKVVHGDINGANILICDDRRAQIADFGLAIVGDATIGRMSTQRTYHGTTRWMSPERLLGLSRRLGSSDDVYAFGGLMYMMFSQKLPWDGLSDTAVVAQVMQQIHPGSRNNCSDCAGVHMSDEVWYLLKSCWAIDASLRPDLPHIRDTIILLKISHDMNALGGDSHSRSSGSGSSSAESTIKVVPTIKSHPPLLFELSSSLQPALGRTPIVRQRRKDRVRPVTKRPSPYGPHLAHPSHLAGVSVAQGSPQPHTTPLSAPKPANSQYGNNPLAHLGLSVDEMKVAQAHWQNSLDQNPAVQQHVREVAQQFARAEGQSTTKRHIQKAVSQLFSAHIKEQIQQGRFTLQMMSQLTHHQPTGQQVSHPQQHIAVPSHLPAPPQPQHSNPPSQSQQAGLMQQQAQASQRAPHAVQAQHALAQAQLQAQAQAQALATNGGVNGGTTHLSPPFAARTMSGSPAIAQAQAATPLVGASNSPRPPSAQASTSDVLSPVQVPAVAAGVQRPTPVAGITLSPYQAIYIPQQQMVQPNFTQEQLQEKAVRIQQYLQVCPRLFSLLVG